MTEITKPRFKTADFGVSSYKATDWRLELQPSQTLDDVNDPHLWKDILGKQAPGDTIAAFKPDSGAYGKFIVLECGPGFIRLAKIEGYTPQEIKEPEGQLGLKWNPGKKSYTVIRKTDGYVMAKDFQTKASAIGWIDDHNAKMAA